MARELRLESPGAYYHIINRGNYRHHVFGPAGVQIAFETCLSRPARSRVGCCTRLWSWATDGCPKFHSKTGVGMGQDGHQRDEGKLTEEVAPDPPE